MAITGVRVAILIDDGLEEVASAGTSVVSPAGEKIRA
jgi:hypothetical protein